MKSFTTILMSILYLIEASSLLAQPPPSVDPVISTQKLAASFHYTGNLEVQDVTNQEIQRLIFFAQDNSFYRVFITVDKPASILTPQIQSIIDAHLSGWNIVTLEDGTKVYIPQLLPIIMMTSKDGRFDLKIEIGPPDDNLEIVKNDKNRQLIEGGAEWYSNTNVIAAVQEIYKCTAKNYDQLVRENIARKNSIIRRLKRTAL